MKLKTLRPLAAALVIASLAPSVIAETMGEEHPAVRVARAWSTRGIDPNTFIVAHPAPLQLLGAASPTEKDKPAGEVIGDTSRSVSPSFPADAQAQAARLLSHPHTAGAWKPNGQVRAPSRVSAAMDAQASAAALLSGSRTVGSANAVLPIDQPSDRHMVGDAQAQAAALLSGSRISADSRLRVQRTHGGARTSAQNL